MSQKLYPDVHLFQLHKLYSRAKTSIAAFARANNLSETALQKGFKRLGLFVLPMALAKRKYPVDDGYFSVIDTEHKAYILGLIFADGCNLETINKLSIKLAESDKDILEIISKTLLFGHVKLYFVNRKRENPRNQNQFMLDVVSTQISQDLARLGAPARKTFILKFPDIPSHLHRHFIRGYFDGDGMLKIYKKTSSGYKYAEFSIVSTKEMLDSIGGHIKTLGVNFSITKRHKKRKNNNFTLRVHGTRQIKHVCNFLYHDATIYGTRKHLMYQHLETIGQTTA